MSSLFELNGLDRRLQDYVARSGRLKPETGRLLNDAMVRGAFERGAAARITGLPERSVRRVLNDAVQEGLLGSDSPKGPESLSRVMFWPRERTRQSLVNYD